jgi:signal transduction histidine kinase/HAMP domain-containing protein
MRVVGIRLSIGGQIFAALLVMGFLIAALGAVGYGMLSAAGGIVADTYDGPLMAISYARAANVSFAQMQVLLLQKKIAAPGERNNLERKIEDALGDFNADLDIAEERASAEDERSIIRQIRALSGRWNKERSRGGPVLAELDAELARRFDMLIELNADHGFVSRREAVWSIGYYKFASGFATALALLLACGLAFMLGGRIITPLSAAAAVADRIAGGELETPIPAGGSDETGILLRSMVVMQNNIRDRVARETAQRQSAESRLGDALESARQCVVLVAADGRVAIANSQLDKFFPGFSGREVAGLPIAELLGEMDTHFAASNGAGSRPSLADVCSVTSGAQADSWERQLKDGRWIRVDADRTSDGGLILLANDFTDIKEREEKFRLAKQAAEAASEAKSRFLANMSHELRTPLNAIIGFSEIISTQLLGATGNAKYTEYAGDILRSGQHLLDVINSVLDISRSETGKMTLVAETVDLRFVLMDCIKMMRQECTSAGLILHSPNLSDPLFVRGEAAKLRQIFLNLLSNAVKFTERGGTIMVRAEHAGADVIAEIADTGIGMRDDEIPIALTPFAQIDSRLARRYEGTGLGLPLSKALIELHGGRLDIQSEPGVGTKVRVVLADASWSQDEHSAVSPWINSIGHRSLNS